jgi:hypothetical protein
MKNFTIFSEPCSIGFQSHARLYPDKPVTPELHRRRIHYRSGLESVDPNEIKKIIEWNSSLRVAFGWGFESTESLNIIMKDCESHLSNTPRFDICNIASDLRCDWIGFIPFNTFDKMLLQDLTIKELIEFNNELINYQIDVVTFISNHRIYQSHAIVRDSEYKYRYFKKIRKDPVALAAAFQYYIDSIMISSGLTSIARDIVEEMIGCHYLYHPDVFFESLNLNILRGTIYER